MAAAFGLAIMVGVTAWTLRACVLCCRMSPPPRQLTPAAEAAQRAIEAAQRSGPDSEAAGAAANGAMSGLACMSRVRVFLRSPRLVCMLRVMGDGLRQM